MRDRIRVDSEELVRGTRDFPRIENGSRALRVWGHRPDCILQWRDSRPRIQTYIPSHDYLATSMINTKKKKNQFQRYRAARNQKYFNKRYFNHVYTIQLIPIAQNLDNYVTGRSFKYARNLRVHSKYGVKLSRESIEMKRNCYNLQSQWATVSTMGCNYYELRTNWRRWCLESKPKTRNSSTTCVHSTHHKTTDCFFSTSL